jgi:hypothetical protein
MLSKRIAIGTGVATALAGIVIAAPGGAAHPLDRHDGARPTTTSVAAWRTGVSARSEALNRLYGLGAYAKAGR